MATAEGGAPRDLGGRRGARERGRDLYTDTHCSTEGYPGSFRPLRLEERREHPVTGAAVTVLVAVVAFVWTWCACYLAGCMA